MNSLPVTQTSTDQPRTFPPHIDQAPCRGCAADEDCLFADAVAVTVLEALEQQRGDETTSGGLAAIIRRATSPWHACGPGRTLLEQALSRAADGTNAHGFRLLLRRELDLPSRT